MQNQADSATNPRFFGLPWGRLPTSDCWATVCLIAAFAAAGWREAAVAASAVQPKQAQRPNVVLVITDDQGYFDLGCHGNHIVQTPNLDRLYTQSIRLTNFHVDPLCSPTRAALMTGRYASSTGVWATTVGRSLLRADERTMADLFAASGYRTAMFGKWHLGDNYPFRPQDRGFQEVLVHGGGGVGQTPDFWGNDYFDDTYFRNGKPEKQSGYCTDVFFAEAIRFIERNQKEPFFCYLATNAPHAPYLVDEKYGKPYRDQGVPQPRAEFFGMIANIDENFGRLASRLDQLGLADRTIVIFLTDNGTAAGERGRMRDGKGSPYEGGHRVPCFLRWPGRFQAGRDISRLTAHFDLLPTLVEVCSLKDAGRGVRFDGISLAPLLESQGEVQWPDRTIIVHRQQQEEPVKWFACAVMTDRWRLVGRSELYDMDADPGQTKSVAEEHRDVVANLLRAYERWWTEIFEPVPVPCRSVIGSDRENPTRLTAFDWCGTDFQIPWDQRQIRDEKFYAYGYWPIEVQREGAYRFTLRRFPQEEDRPIGATTAWMKVGQVEMSAAIPDTAAEVRFEVWLRAGKTRLEAKFTEKRTGRFRGVHFVYVQRLP